MSCGTVYLPPILKINVTSINIIKFNQNNAVEMLINDSIYSYFLYIVFMNAVAVYKLFVLYLYSLVCIHRTHTLHIIWNVDIPSEGASYSYTIYRIFE